MKQLLLLMNPYAGTRRGARYLAEIVGVFNRADLDVHVYLSDGPGDCTRAARERAKDMDLVVCAGGDGTFNETLCGLLQSGTDVPMGYIPCGSTNDFAASLRLPLQPVEAAEAIVQGELALYDVGKFQDRYFSYVASFGAFTKTSYSTPQNLKNVMGHLAYVLTGFRELFLIPKEHFRIETDIGVFEDDYIFGAISNSTSVGGILTLDPTLVDMQDGLFELMLIRPPKDPAELIDLVTTLGSQKYDSPMLTFHSVRWLKVTSEHPVDWTLDGERAPGISQVEIRNLHKAMRLVRGTLSEELL